MTLKGFFLRLLGGFALFTITLALVIFIAAFRAERSSTDVAQMFEKVRLSEELQIHLLSTNREWFLYGLTGEPEHNRNQIKEEESVRNTLVELRSFMPFTTHTDLLLEVTQSAENYLKARNELRHQGLTAAEAYREANISLKDAHAKAANLARHNLDQASIAIKRSQSGVNFLSMVALGVLILYSLLLPYAWTTVRRWIYKPIRDLSSGLTRFREAESETIVEPTGIDEIRSAAEAFNDLTWRLADQKKARLRFLAGVAHDLKNPLSGIKMSAQILDQDDLPTEQKRQMIDIISRQSDQLDRMVGDFLDASRIEVGHLELVKSPQDLRIAINDSVLLHQQVSPRHNITFHAPSQPIPAECDLTRITQVLNNIINNAIKYSPNGGEVKVNLEIKNHEALIHITDEGIGISREDLEKVFEPFRRTQMTKATIPGVGLGLSVSKHIIERHNGKIEIESNPGVGSTFTIRLPLLKEFKDLPYSEFSG